jgi:hypothetical protein
VWGGCRGEGEVVEEVRMDVVVEGAVVDEEEGGRVGVE